MKGTHSGDPREAIVGVLRQHPEGLTIKDIAELTGSHRHTITKYVYELTGAQVILQRDVGAAKLCYLVETYAGKERMKGSIGIRMPWKGQAQLLTLLVLLLLVPATVIVAQNVTNSTTTDGMLAAANVTEGATLSDVPSDINATPDESTSSEAEISDAENQTVNVPAGNVTEELQNVMTVVTDENATTPEENLTAPENNTTLPEENTTMPEDNLTLPEDNGTFSNDNVTIPEENVTVPEENITIPESNETLPEDNVTQTAEALLELTLSVPDRVTRGEVFNVYATMRNFGNGTARNIVLEWHLPPGFEMVTDGTPAVVGDIPPGEESVYEVSVHSSTSSERGLNEIRVTLTYE